MKSPISENRVDEEEGDKIDAGGSNPIRHNMAMKSGMCYEIDCDDISDV